MAVLPILIIPDPRLKQRAKPVTAVDDRIRRLADDMLETMYAAPGIGLAGPQVGALERILVMDVAGEDEKPRPLRLINPQITWRSGETTTHSEGCLSIPEMYADVTRPAAVRVRYLDETGAAQELAAEGLLATCVQHEIDHLDGVLFIDHLSPLKRNMIVRKVAKTQRSKARA